MSTLRSKKIQKVLVIEGLSDLPEPPQNFAHESWKDLKSSLRELMSLTRMKYGREHMYKTVNALCNNGDTQFILDKLMKFLYKYINKEMTQLSNFIGDVHQYIDMYDSHWDKYQKNIISVLSVFMYLDGEIKTKGEISIANRADRYYQEKLISTSAVYSRLINGVMVLIYEERAHEMDHKLQLKRIVLMLEKLNIYKDQFYKYFIDETDKYYKEMSKSIFESTNVSDYLRCIEKMLKKEKERIENYLSVSSTRESIDKVELWMIKDIAESIIEKGMKQLINNSKLDDLKLLYMLFKQVNMLGSVEVGFNKVVKDTGLGIVSPQNDEKGLINALLEFREKVEIIMQISFENNIKFKYSNKLVWEGFINTNQKISVLCAKDLDENLKKGSKVKLSDQELEIRIDGIISLFKLVNSKDVFEAIYFQQLAKRYLLDKSKSADLEKSVITKLKAECGATFISRLRNIQNDIDFSKTYMEHFHRENAVPFDFHVWTLTGQGWPRNYELKPILPPELLSLQEKYTIFYTNLMKKKILNWNSSISYCEIQCNLPNGNKSLTVTLHQALVLLLFNKADALSMERICEMAGLPIGVLGKEVLQICAKCKILTKDSKGKEISGNEIIKFNPNFTHKLYKIVINSLQIKETKIEVQQTIEKVMSERQYIVDAAIVRIMKARRQLSHSALLSECFNIVRFNISAVEVKKRIERLIEQEYLRRDENDRTLYHYIT